MKPKQKPWPVGRRFPKSRQRFLLSRLALGSSFQRLNFKHLKITILNIERLSVLRWCNLRRNLRWRRRVKSRRRRRGTALSWTSQDFSDGSRFCNLESEHRREHSSFLIFLGGQHSLRVTLCVTFWLHAEARPEPSRITHQASAITVLCTLYRAYHLSGYHTITNDKRYAYHTSHKTTPIR